jgi:hypothetical protein
MQLYEGTNRTGMIQLLEDWTGTESSSNYTRQAKTRDLNLGLDAYMALSIPPLGLGKLTISITHVILTSLLILPPTNRIITLMKMSKEIRLGTSTK